MVITLASTKVVLPRLPHREYLFEDPFARGKSRRQSGTLQIRKKAGNADVLLPKGCTVAAAWPAGYSITSTRTTWVSTAAAMGNLIKLSYLDGLPDTFEINAYDASLVTGYTVAGTWYSIL
ncbi:Immediate early response 3-interacting protein 1 [Vespula maculifrons]|uniref:Uncharacterized protein n=2 Tax=Vespula TaxID=7451 RepID=A0A834NNA5_VESGE|nr:hypothetical protein HZH68_002956 [Vespula germanica]